MFVGFVIMFRCGLGAELMFNGKMVFPRCVAHTNPTQLPIEPTTPSSNFRQGNHLAKNLVTLTLRYLVTSWFVRR